MNAVLINKASKKLVDAIKAAKTEIEISDDPLIKSMEPSGLVLKKILAGEKNLHDPTNSGDMLILEMASWE